MNSETTSLDSVNEGLTARFDPFQDGLGPDWIGRQSCLGLARVGSDGRVLVVERRRGQVELPGGVELSVDLGLAGHDRLEDRAGVFMRSVELVEVGRTSLRVGFHLGENRLAFQQLGGILHLLLFQRRADL